MKIQITISKNKSGSVIVTAQNGFKIARTLVDVESLKYAVSKKVLIEAAIRSSSVAVISEMEIEYLD